MGSQWELATVGRHVTLLLEIVTVQSGGPHGRYNAATRWVFTMPTSKQGSSRGAHSVNVVAVVEDVKHVA